MEPTLAEIRIFAGNFAPRSWALCEGQILAINSNQSLYSLLGTTYGGDGRTSFALPDLRGRVPLGAGDGAGLTERSLGQKSGNYETFLNTSHIPAHNHAVAAVTGTISLAPGAGATPIGANNAFASAAGTDNLFIDAAPGTSKLRSGALTMKSTVGNFGGSLPMENRQPTLAINYIIALQGLFPSRS